jgi:phosphoadenosine phosphosulfate reductase
MSMPSESAPTVVTPEEIAEHARHLESQQPRAILEWTLVRFPGEVALSASFAGGGIVLAHLLSQIDPSVPVLFLDTGFHFPETLEFKERLSARLGITVQTLTPATDPGPLYETDADACCQIRKVDPMQRALESFTAWVSALRRDQGPTRASVSTIELHERGERPLIKIHPLAKWTRDDVARYVREHDLPSHPLLSRGYSSIGCWPCTRPTLPGESERAGRWSGTNKVECGLHTFTKRS